MDVEKDIVALSIPFTAGVSLAALLPSEFFPCYTVSFIAGACLALLFTLQVFIRRTQPATMILFFLLGIFCYCNSRIIVYPHLADLYKGETAARICGIIEDIGFKGRNTSALAQALITGRRNGLPAETISYFRESGASHLLALSGLHLGIIYTIVSKTMGIFGRSPLATRAKAILIFILSGLYAIFTGASPSIVRAFIFINLGELASISGGRRKDSLHILCAALIIQLAFNPQNISSAGFQLSYLAMLGIFLLYPLLKGFYPEGRGIMHEIWNSAAMSLSCQIFTAPVVWFRFGTFPEYFLITNLVSLPLTEAFVATAVLGVCLQMAGGCPQILKNLGDFLAQALQYCLSVIAGL